MVTTALAALPLAPASADVEMFDPIVLPQTGDGDVVHLPGTRTLVIAGGSQSPVVRVDLLERSVTEVVDSVGIGDLALSSDGQLLHGVDAAGDVVEVDPWADVPHVTRRWNVSSTCGGLAGVVERGGSIWIAGCGGPLRRLDPDSGEVTAASGGLEASYLVGDPGGPGFYTLHNDWPAVLTHQVPDGDALVEVASETDSHLSIAHGTLRISDDGGTLFLPVDSGLSVGTATWDTTTLSRGPTWSRPVPVTWVDGDLIGGAVSTGKAPVLVDRVGLTEINRFLPDDASAVTTSDVRLVAGNLVTTVWVGDEKRVYVVDDPTTPEPRLTLEVPWYSTGVETPTPVEGTVRWNGEPVPDRELVLSEVEPARRVVGTLTTDDSGSWSTTWTPDTAGWHTLEVRFASTRDSVARVRVYVDEVYQRVDLSAPTSVAGGETIPVTATATRNGRPQAGVEVSLLRWDIRSTKWNATDVGTLTTDEDGVARFSLPPGAVDRWFIQGEWTFPDGYHWQSDNADTLVVDVLRTATVLEIGDTPATARAGDPVDVSFSLTTVDGEPVADETLELNLANDTDWIQPRVTTGDDGTATYVDTLEGEGMTRVHATFPGSLTLDDSSARRDTVERYRVPDALSVEGPSDGQVGVPLTLAGTVAGADGPLELTIEQELGPQIQVTTAADGDWTAEVAPAQHGVNNLVVRFAGDNRIQADSVVHTVTTPLAQPVIVLDPVDVRVGEPLRLRGTVTGLVRPTEVEVRQDGVLIGPRSVGVDGVLDLPVATFLQPVQHTYEVTLVANARQESASASIAVVVEPVPTLSNELRGGTTDTHFAGYRIYDAGVRPRLSSTIRPRDLDSCVERVVERFRSHRWREVERDCLDYAGERRLETRVPTGPARVRFRVRTELPDPARPTITSRWSFYRFSR
jgi:hypothetical protein